MCVLCPSIFTDAMHVLKVIQQTKEFCYFLSLTIILYIKKLALYMLKTWQSFYSGHLTDADIAIARVIIALKGSFEALNRRSNTSALREPSS
ncbi:hypothetical protein P3L47_01710 [Parabacteroides chongii]|nr:hypothetical protein [Parabacteroides chongii]WFE85333.1 hypothetical protein P3L47_01710 [Parabacteroides chongii]